MPNRESRVFAEVASGAPVSGSVSTPIDEQLHPQELAAPLDSRLDLAVHALDFRIREEPVGQLLPVATRIRLEREKVLRGDGSRALERCDLGFALRVVVAQPDLVRLLAEAHEADLELGVAHRR
jgi:hypothetical protein